MSYVPPATPTFEKDRIRALKNERISSQKKTFTKWINSFLNKSKLHVNDLFTDLADGTILISLLEIISGEKIGRAARGKFRVHNIQNINRALEFLQKSVNARLASETIGGRYYLSDSVYTMHIEQMLKVKLASIGAEDIIDGNEQLILGLVWMIILRFQIADISYEDEMSRERKSAKEALLLWCQRMTRGYPGVDVQNFTTSWRNGLAFNALIHKHRPDLIDYAALRPSQHEANLNNAFYTAEDRLGIARLLDAEDVDCPRPDDRSIMTYVSAYYQYFAKMKSEETGGRRVAKIISTLMEIEGMEVTYESMVSNLLSWIQTKILEMSKPFHKSLSAVQKEMMTFKHFRTIEKPPKYAERVNIEAHLFNLQTKRNANHQKPYAPREGSYVKDVNRAWQVMENTEHNRALALRNELIRQEMLEKMADKFERKATLRESWLDDMMHVLEEEQLTQDAATVEAALKRHEAISTDVKAREERFQMVFNLAQELIDEDYHRSNAVRAREEVIMTKWDKLVSKLEARRSTLMGLRDLVGVFRDMESAHADLIDIETGLRSEDYGRHLLAVENLLQKHSLVESQIVAQGERIGRILAEASKFIQAEHPESRVIKERQTNLTHAYQALVELGNARKARLEDALKGYQFFSDLEVEELFIKETEQLASSKEVGKDFASLTRLRKRHEALEAEVSGRCTHCDVIFAKGQLLIDREHFASKEVKAKIKQVQANWIRVKELVQNREERLKDAAQSLQYYSDANDAESWMTEKMTLVRSDDYGHDEQSATSLLQRHQQIQEEISSFSDDIDKLKEKSKLMGGANKAKPPENEITYETYMEEMEVETDEEVEEVVEKEVVKDVIKEVKVSQVTVLYPYSGQGLAVQKGETLFLINKTNNDWWSVRRNTSREAGYVPAKYVKEIEPCIVKKTTRQKMMVPQTVKVKRKVMKTVAVQRQKPLTVSPSRSPKTIRRGKQRGVRRHFTAHFDRDNVAVRQITLTNTYNRLVELSQLRQRNLENAIKYYHFSNECNNMEIWMTNKEKQLNSKESNHSSDIIRVTRKKLEGFDTELSAKSALMAEINAVADDLISNNGSNTIEVKKSRKELNERWGALQQLKEHKAEELEEKHGVELFYNSCQELQSWIHEKDGLLCDEDVGRDIETVRALQRRHQGFERDLAAVEDKMTKLKDQARSLVSEHPRQARQIKSKEAEILGIWNDLKAKAEERKALLDDVYGQQGFFADTRDLLSWVNETKQIINSAEDPQDIATATEMIEKHDERLEDIETHYERFVQLHDYAQKLLKANPRAVKVKQNVALLTEAKNDLDECWVVRNDLLQQALDLQVFIRDAEQFDAATASHQASLSSKDIGASVDDVGRLLKKHEDTEKTLLAQEEKMQALADMAKSLFRAEHYEKEWIAKRVDEVVKRRQSVKQRANQRREALVQSQVLQNFLRDVDEFDGWIIEKMQIATDGSYQDPKNLQGKLQRHKAFEAELAANKDGIDRINADGKHLIKSKHFGSGEIQHRLDEINDHWLQLCNNSADKSVKLQQASQQQQFNRVMDDFQLWMHDAEAVLASEDQGRDMSEVKFLLKKHQLAEADIEVHVTEVERVACQAQEFVDDEHFNSPSIQQSAADVLKRFKDLKHLSSNRRSHLEDSFGLNQLLYDIDIEMSWIREHKRIASSEDLGSNLVSVQRLQKRHIAFENELTNHGPKVRLVLSCGQDLIDSGHPASEKVEERLEELKSAWENLGDASAHRKTNLDESYKSQKYFAEANEADSWMNDKAGAAASQDYGKEERATDKLLTRHRALETDVESFSDVIKELANDAKRLVRSNHFDSKKITSTQRDLEEQLSGLRTLVGTRNSRLEESKKLHQYLREVDETAEWINQQIHTASSEDYGKDFEHLETIQTKFEDFQRSVTVNTDTYRSVDNLAKKLVAEGHTDTVTIKEQQDILRSMFAQLQDQILLRKKRLASAAEIHRFNRDMNELISRIQEKDTKLTLDDLGRDLASAEALQRKHEVFKRELISVEKQVDDLLAESTRLQQTYQGQTAHTIQKHEEFVKTLWADLKRKSSRKQHKLKDSIAFHKLNIAIRDQITWCIDMARTVSSDEPIHNVSDAEALLRQLEEHHVVIEAREETFTRILERGEKMIEDGHFASEELTEKLELLLTERENLYASWDDRKAEVEQAYHLHVFLRDARQVDSVYSSQEAVLVKADLGNSVDEVDFLLKKHENVEKLVLSQDDKLDAITSFGKKLIADGHDDERTINERLDALASRRKKLQNDLTDRRTKLEDSRKIAQFYQDVVEAEAWITEKLQAAQDESYRDPTNLESKLQKHQAFEAELTAHEDIIDSVQRSGEELISSGHFSANEVEARIESLYIHWEELLEASGTKGRKLEEARDHKKFNTEVDIADSSISDKEAIVSTEDIGNDYEHCVRLQKKMKEFDQDLAVEEDRVATINHLADKLVNEGHAGSALIYQRQQALNERWNALQDKASERRQRLAEACDIHAFNRSCKEVADMINEKDVILSTEDFGRDLPGVEALIRKHDDVERGLTVIEGKMEVLENEAHRLVRSQPHMARTVQAKQTDIIENWEQLNDKFDERKGRLEANRLLQIFLVDYRDLTSWMGDLDQRITNGELANNVKDAQALLDLHRERKSEIDARQESITAAHAFGLSLVQQNHFAEEEIKGKIKNLSDMSLHLQNVWQDRQKLLEQSYELQVFLASADQADNWITNKQNIITENESNDSLDTVHTQLKTQVNFEKSIAAYEKNIDALNQSATDLIESNHYEADIIKRRQIEVLEKWRKLKGSAAAKSEKLGESKLLFQFLRDADEMESWINEKLQTAAEASYREASNLQIKLQKHDTFEAEITANKGQLDSIIKDGDSLLKTFPIHQETVEKRRKDLTDLWTLLEDLSANKALRLKEAIQKQTFDRNVTELETWMDEVYGALSSKENGKDLRSTGNLMKKHKLTEEDILNHEERVNDILEQATAFEEADHFQKDEISERAADVAERFEQLSEPAATRGQMLEDSLVLFQFINDTQEEMDWIREKKPLVSSEDYGHNLNGVQNLLKKHEAFEAELNTHEQLVGTVYNTAKTLVNSGHFATGLIMDNLNNLKSSWAELTRLADIRKEKLNESLATQQYYAQVSEIETWVQEKLPLVSNEDYGRDETSAKTLLRKHETLQLEFEIFDKRIVELDLQFKHMVEQGNCDSDAIQKRQNEIQERYAELSDISSYRHRRLIESCRLHVFLREVDEVDAWIEEKETIVTSDDCGRDLEHVDMLMEKFEAFTRDLVVSGERIAKLALHAQELLDEEHSDSEVIEERAEQICSRWEILKERTSTRLNALDRAKDFHAFNRNVEETKAWIQEKENALKFTDEGARDLSSVQALQRKHEGFQRDLKALGKKVANLSQDADILMDKIPDEKTHFTEQKRLVIEAWDNLQQRASSKKSVLSQSEGLQTFLSDYQDLMSWIDTMFVTVSSDEVASDFSAAEQLVAQHQEQQAEVATHEKSVQDFQEAAQKLIKSGHPQSADIKDKNKRLSEAWENLLDCFKKKQGHLEQVKEVQRFKKEADQLEGWLNARDADLMSQDVGDSLEAVEALLKKQDEFENILLAKGNHFQGLMKLTNQEMESEKQKKEQDKELQKQQKIKKKEDEKTIPKNNDEIKDNVKEKSILKPKPKVKPKPKLQEQRKQVNDRELINNEHKINNKAGSEKINSGKQIAKHNTENKPFEERLNQEAKEPEIKPQTSHEQLLQNSIESFPTKEPGDRVEGFLKIKQELDVGRLKPSSRAWKTFYTVFDDGNLLFYMDRTSASNSDPAASLDLKGCRVEEAVIRKNTFRLFVQDGSEFLFTAKDTNDFVRWIDKINTWNQASTESLHSQPAANNGQGNSVQRSQLSNPVITVTSFDSDDSDVDLPLIISPPPDIPPPFLPDDDFQIEVPESYNSDGVDENNTEEDYHNGNEGVGYNGDDIDTVNQYDDANDYVDDFILSEEDIHPEFYPDAPTDFNDNSFPDIPSIPPPQIPPEDFRDLEQGMVDDDDMMVYPKAPPPPVKTKTQISSDQEGYISSGSDGLPSPPKLIKPTQKFNITHGIIPHKKKRAPPPPRDKDPAARYRSDSQDSRGSDDFVPKYPSRPYHDKGVHDDKKQDKKKGMFGFLKKKK